ncbi:hypothetical protein [uncultured Pontibacter sp.]|uniref:hypothetical protein n=1 Tax=uncultured Pontibacter sp. TaxID=453356 RepID=UPI0026275921|nr:hypothetical protein [uncultured Pontibacter sp.]
MMALLVGGLAGLLCRHCDIIAEVILGCDGAWEKLKPQLNTSFRSGQLRLI